MERSSWRPPLEAPPSVRATLEALQVGRTALARELAELGAPAITAQLLAELEGLEEPPPLLAPFLARLLAFHAATGELPSRAPQLLERLPTGGLNALP